MAGADMITVEVAYARPDRQTIIAVAVPVGATLEQAIALARLPERFPEIDLLTCQVGIFGKIRPLSTALRGGDRVEVYRPLPAAESRRRRRAARRQFDETGPDPC